MKRENPADCVHRFLIWLSHLKQIFYLFQGEPVRLTLQPASRPSIERTPGVRTNVIVSTLVHASTFLSALMTYWWRTCLSSGRGFFFSCPLECPAVPMSKVSPRTFSFLIISQPFPIYLKLGSLRSTSWPQQPFESSVRTNVLKRKELEEACDKLVLPGRDLHGGA